ncbi:hypothetical protein VTP01DRAFT_387 [Rhizomucor pusillus]|uniref:uncharacterized protein n=1 Tax=Rhizomucor pusillus TaxID=4840 RepID=UPI003742C7BA
MTAPETANVEPEFVQAKPYKVELEPGKEYYWCACGKSKSQPFCDGSHRGGPFKPKKIVVDEKKEYYLCGCKFTHNENGYCDGTHRKEEGIKKYNEFLLKSNSNLKQEREQLQTKLKNAELKQTVTVGTLSAAIVGIVLVAKYTNLLGSRH